MALNFTWDPQKAASNVRKHGVSFAEAATVFADPLALFVQDSVHEDRLVLIGASSHQRVLFTVFAEVSDDTVRIISARRVTVRERRRYEEGQS
ncbi:MAG: BrnT family toxin [Myxococcota bacterium]|nr:BrnT family toxin [Myxococcota bacterium]